MQRLELLKELTEAFGPSGYENEVANILHNKLKNYGKVNRDRLGSVICEIPPSPACTGVKDVPKIMFAAHMDEIGFIVSSITKEGYLRFLPIGGWLPTVLLGQRVIVRTEKGDFFGIIGSKPPHEMTEEERKQLPDLDKMFIDIGCGKGVNIKTEFGVKPGDPVVPVSPFTALNNSFLLAKAWDDRVGCGLIIETAEALSKPTNSPGHPNTLYFVGTTQEEVGLRGAKTAADIVNPDIAIAIDVSLSREYPGFIEAEVPERLKGGAAILVHDRTMIPNIRLRDFVIGLAEKNKISYHLTSVRGGYDTGMIHLHKSGVPSLAIGVPARYIHSHAGIISLEDYENVLKLLILIAQNLTKSVLENILSF